MNTSRMLRRSSVLEMKLYPSNDKLCEWMDDTVGVDGVDGHDELMSLEYLIEHTQLRRRIP